MNYLEMFKETMGIMKMGGYWMKDDVKMLKFNLEEMKMAEVFSEEDVYDICERFSTEEFFDGMVYVENKDSYEAARELSRNHSNTDRVLAYLCSTDDCERFSGNVRSFV